MQKREHKLGKKEMGRVKESIETHLVAKIVLKVLISGRIQFNERQMMLSDDLSDRNHTDKLFFGHVH